MALIEPLPLARQGRFSADSTEFTAIDFETTGLAPGHILEVAAVRMRADGTVLGELSTLVNPGSGIDPGPTHVHHITRTELDRAPSPSDVLAQLVEMCRGSVLVAHNLAFETRFLEAELDRLGVRLPPLRGICLQAVARQLFRLPNYRLTTIAGALGIGDFPAHLALGDARVSGRVLAALITVHGLGFTEEPRLPKLPRLPGGGRLLPRADLAPARQGGWLAELVDRLPEDLSERPEGGTAELGVAYRELLADALADRHLSETEAAALARLAESAGMSRADVRRAHVEFVKALRLVAEGDGVVTTEEERDLRAVAGTLDVGEVLVDLRSGAADTTRARPTRVLVLGESAAADELRAEILDARIQLAKKLTSSVTHLIVGRDVPASEPRIERAAELGAAVVELGNAREALGLVTAQIPIQTVVLPSPQPPLQAFPPPPRISRSWDPPARQVDPVDRLGTVAGWVLVGIGLLIMSSTVLAAFGGVEVAPALVASVLGVGSLLGGWWLTERHRTRTTAPG
ncbi:DNA polymerase-3 subunit epsilon [Amycolatopsis marina]|uniref:DNA polymerase-3 subunit epsilon n=1 Tax=Amycolatopsis marina TaxID=490629 RepID=A0A1I0W9K8_9PSEU|nr:3'-5' exonuclease [Amycolatopsis marina]SFA84596.1 DNA polymerase-3 subunit epsilon [Amycolatopsis marina]